MSLLLLAAATAVTLSAWHCCFSGWWCIFQWWEKKVQRKVQNVYYYIWDWPGGNVLNSVSGSCFFSLFESESVQSETRKGYWSEEPTKQQHQELSWKNSPWSQIMRISCGSVSSFWLEFPVVQILHCHRILLSRRYSCNSAIFLTILG